MIAYHLLYGQILISILLSFFDKRFDKYLISAFVLTLILFAGLRYGIGVDYFSYFEVLSSLASGQHLAMEPGFLLLGRVVSFIGGREQLLYLLSSLITIYFVYKYISEFSFYPLLSLYVYVAMPVLYLASFNGIRQFIAVAIFSYSIKYILRKSISKFVILLLIASTFHVTVILMMPCYFILNRITKLKHFILVAVTYFILVSGADIIINVLHMSSKYLSGYYENEGVNYKSLIFIPLFLIFLFFRDKLSSVFSGTNVFITMLYINILLALTPLFSNLPAGLVNRISSYMTVSLIILLPNFVRVINDKNIRYMYLLLLLLFPALYFYATLKLNGEAYMLVPYEANFKLF